MIELSEDELLHFDDNFETEDLLHCVGTLDEMRKVLGADIRLGLMQIHTLLFEGIKQADGRIEDDLPDVLFDVIEGLDTLIDDAKSVLKLLNNAKRSLPARIFEEED